MMSTLLFCTLFMEHLLDQQVLQVYHVYEKDFMKKLWPFISKYLCDWLIKKQIGFDSCRSLTSGAAGLNKTVRNRFAGFNMPILDGYECGGCVCPSRLNNLISDSVGPPLARVELRISY